MSFIFAVTTQPITWPANQEAGLAVASTFCLTLLAALIIFRRELAHFATASWESVTAVFRSGRFNSPPRSAMRQRLELEVSALRDQLAQMEAGLGDAPVREHSEGFAEMRASLDYLARQVDRNDR